MTIESERPPRSPRELPNEVSIEIRQPRATPQSYDSLEFHAARLLLLVAHAGGRSRRIEGRTKLAKLDFLIRYPAYLVEAARLLGENAGISTVARPESPMIRYKFGPWDDRYYNIFAYLVAKDLIRIEATRKGDAFTLTERGKAAVDDLDGLEYDQIVDRCRLAFKLFGQHNGTYIKDFIYRHFAQVIDRPLGARINE